MQIADAPLKPVFEFRPLSLQRASLRLGGCGLNGDVIKAPGRSILHSRHLGDWRTRNRQPVVQKDVGSNSRCLFLHSKTTNDDLRDVWVELKLFTTVFIRICELPQVSLCSYRPCQTSALKQKCFLVLKVQFWVVYKAALREYITCSHSASLHQRTQAESSRIENVGDRLFIFKSRQFFPLMYAFYLQDFIKAPQWTVPRALYDYSCTLKKRGNIFSRDRQVQPDWEQICCLHSQSLAAVCFLHINCGSCCALIGFHSRHELRVMSLKRLGLVTLRPNYILFTQQGKYHNRI